MNYSKLISLENIFQAWDEFKKGKRNKKDVQILERYLEDNLFDLYSRLKNKTYKHGPYSQFWVNDPKRRHIHKAQASDRIVHHLLHKYLYELFDKTFIFDSYSCRLNKGTHRAIRQLESFSRKLSKNYTQDFWALKLDIKQFFASVDHRILKNLIEKKMSNRKTLWLINQVIDSYSSSGVERKAKKVLGYTRTISDVGIPLGNLTSQIFANIYLNELDQFIKHKLKIKYYLRYADDFLILDQDQAYLYRCIDTLKQFLKNNLKLELHPKKIILRKLSWGIDFCGYTVLPHYILPRTKTKRRIINKIGSEEVSKQAYHSYLGYFSHADGHKIQEYLKNLYWFKDAYDGV